MAEAEDPIVEEPIEPEQPVAEEPQEPEEPKKKSRKIALPVKQGLQRGWPHLLIWRHC